MSNSKLSDTQMSGHEVAETAARNSLSFLGQFGFKPSKVNISENSVEDDTKEDDSAEIQA